MKSFIFLLVVFNGIIFADNMEQIYLSNKKLCEDNRFYLNNSGFCGMLMHFEKQCKNIQNQNTKEVCFDEKYKIAIKYKKG